MAEEETDQAEATESADEEGTEDGEEKKSGMSKMLLFGAPVALLIIGGAVAYFLGFFGSEPEHVEGEHVDDPQHVEAEAEKHYVFYDLPELIVNLNSSAGTGGFLKIQMALEIEQGAKTDELEAVMPRIVDGMQVFLRELRLEDLQGSAGIFRVREELLRRINNAVEPINVHDVLFKELIVQ